MFEEISAVIGGRQAHSNVVRSHAHEMAKNPSGPLLPHCDTLNTKYELNDMYNDVYNISVDL